MAIDQRTLRTIRLNHEYIELMQLNGSTIKIEPLGKAPFDSYRITFQIRTIIDATPTYQNSTVCILNLPENFPFAMPRLHIDRASGSKPPWHVNWYRGGTWCAGNWSAGESLANYIGRCAKTLQFDKTITNIDSPANAEAISFWNANQNKKYLIPCDHQVLPTTAAAPTFKKIQILK